MISPVPIPVGGWDKLIVVKASSQPNNLFLGSPSITYRNGKLIVSCDEFGAGATSGRSHTLESDLDAEIWSNLESPLDGIYWGRFIDYDPDVLYLFGTQVENGALRIAKTTDDGLNWTFGTIRTGFHHAAPTNYIRKDGKIYAAFETVNNGTFRPEAVRVGFADETSDLSVAANWTFSNEILFSANSGTWSPGIEFLEFNIVLLENGEIRVIGRILYGNENMAHLTYNDSTNTLAFYAKTPCDFGWCKFHVIECPFSGYHLIIGNKRHPPLSGTTEDRTSVCLWKTKDFIIFEEVFIFVDVGVDNYLFWGVQYPYGYIHEETKTLYVAYRVGRYSNTAHNSNEIRIAVYENYLNLLG